MDVKDEYLSLLASSADEITREINGVGVDVEQLHNIKKNMCSEDCTFCGQSAFYNTGIDTYELPPRLSPRCAFRVQVLHQLGL